jgi:hypothetical protein
MHFAHESASAAPSVQDHLIIDAHLQTRAHEAQPTIHMPRCLLTHVWLLLHGRTKLSSQANLHLKFQVKASHIQALKPRKPAYITAAYAMPVRRIHKHMHKQTDRMDLQRCASSWGTLARP